MVIVEDMANVHAGDQGLPPAVRKTFERIECPGFQVLCHTQRTCIESRVVSGGGALKRGTTLCGQHVTADHIVPRGAHVSGLYLDIGMIS